MKGLAHSVLQTASFFSQKNTDEKIIMCELERFPMDFGAETLGVCSPHEYSKSTTFQLQTPSGSAPTHARLFSHHVGFSRFAGERNELAL